MQCSVTYLDGNSLDVHVATALGEEVGQFVLGHGLDAFVGEAVEVAHLCEAFHVQRQLFSMGSRLFYYMLVLVLYLNMILFDLFQRWREVREARRSVIVLMNVTYLLLLPFEALL